MECGIMFLKDAFSYADWRKVVKMGKRLLGCGIGLGIAGFICVLWGDRLYLDNVYGAFHVTEDEFNEHYEKLDGSVEEVEEAET